MTKRIIFLVAVLCGFILQTSCKKNIPTKTLLSISVEKLPTKTIYKAGEEIDLSGIVVKAFYSNNEKVDVNIDKSNIDNIDESQAGVIKVRIKFEDKTTLFNLERIIETPKILESIKVVKLPTKTIYSIGEEILLDGIIVEGIYDNGSKENISVSKSNIKNIDESVKGLISVTLEVEKITTTFDLTRLLIVVKDGVLREVQDDNLDRLVLPNNIKIISKEVFKNKNIKTIVLNENLEKIEEGAFIFSTLQEIVFNENLKVIGKEAFYNCENLKAIDLSKTQLTSVSDATFAWSGIESIKFSKTIKIIEDQAFWQTKKLLNVVVPETVLEIGLETFRESAVKSLTLPNNIKILGNRAFYMCRDLQEVKTYGDLNGSEDSYAGVSCFEQCTSLATLQIPSEIRVIKQNFVNDNSLIKKIELSDKVKQIDFAAFSASQISEISIKAENPPLAGRMEIAWDAFPKTLTLISVPANSVEKYKNAKGWKQYANIINSNVR